MKREKDSQKAVCVYYCIQKCMWRSWWRWGDLLSIRGSFDFEIGTFVSSSKQERAKPDLETIMRVEKISS